MSQRNPELPEGTDHIINGAMETGAGSDASTGSSGGTGFIGGGESGGLGDGTGGTAALGGTSGGMTGGGTGTGGGSGGYGGGTGGGMGGGGMSGGTGGSGGGAPVKQQLRDGAQSLKQQATDKVRTYAEDGKSRASTALLDLSQVFNDTASTIDERLGAEYGDYARRAAGAVTDFATNLQGKDVEELFEGARSMVRKSPGVAIGTAAVLGFALVRLIKAGVPDDTSGGSDYRTGGTGSTGSTGVSDYGTAGSMASTGGTSTAGTGSVASQAPSVGGTTGTGL